MLLTRKSNAQLTEINQAWWRMQPTNVTYGGCSLPFEKRPKCAGLGVLQDRFENHWFTVILFHHLDDCDLYTPREGETESGGERPAIYFILFYKPLAQTTLNEWQAHQRFYFILFYSILFYSILFYSILFYSILQTTCTNHPGWMASPSQFLFYFVYY